MVYLLTLGVYWWDPCFHIYSSTMDPLGDSLHTNQQKHILRANPIPCTWKVWDLRPSRALFHLSCRRFLVDFFEDMGWSLPTYLDPQKYHHKMVKVLKSWGKTSFFWWFLWLQTEEQTLSWWFVDRLRMTWSGTNGPIPKRRSGARMGPCVMLSLAAKCAVARWSLRMVFLITAVSLCVIWFPTN